MIRKNSLICDLKTRRQTVGWSIKELSDRCGIDEAFLSDWEKMFPAAPVSVPWISTTVIARACSRYCALSRCRRIGPEWWRRCRNGKVKNKVKCSASHCRSVFA